MLWDEVVEGRWEYLHWYLCLMKLQPGSSNFQHTKNNFSKLGYLLTACVCRVGMYAWQHISSVDLAAAATTNLSAI